MNNPTQNTLPSLPVEELLINTARGVVTAQRRLDEASLAAELRIQEEELDKQFGLKAHWYTIPELDFDLKLAFEIDSRGQLKTQMVDPDYQSRYGFNVKASSELKTKIVAVPPTQGEGYRMLDKKRAVEIAGRIKRMVERYLESQSPHFAVYFQSLLSPGASGYAGGLWYVMLLDTLDSGRRVEQALCVISDLTGEIIRYRDIQEREPVTMKDVTFTFQEQIAVLDYLNESSREQLDVVTELDSRSVKSIMKQRPFYEFQTAAATRYMGDVAWHKVKELALKAAQAGAQNTTGDQGGAS